MPTQLNRVAWEKSAWSDYCELIEKNEKRFVAKINKLIKDILRNGIDKGIGHPEPLKHDLAGNWSREISGEHRLVYYQEENLLHIIECYSHYTEVKK